MFTGKESIVEKLIESTLCFSESETDTCYVGLIGKKILKKGLGNEKKYSQSESRICVFACVGEKKINSFEITVIIFETYKECKNLQFK